MRREQQVAALAAVAGAALAAGATFLTWFRIEVGGVLAPGGSQTGWEGRDGRTVLGGAVLAALAAGLIALGKRIDIAEVVLLLAGGITAVVALAGIVDTRSKAQQVQSQFGIEPGRVVAQVGAGLWLVAVAGLVELGAAVVAHRMPERAAPSDLPVPDESDYVPARD
jgi:hypothetical protein